MSFPSEGMELTQLLVVKEVERSKAFHRGVLGATFFREYGGTSRRRKASESAHPVEIMPRNDVPLPSGGTCRLIRDHSFVFLRR